MPLNFFQILGHKDFSSNCCQFKVGDSVVVVVVVATTLFVVAPIMYVFCCVLFLVSDLLACQSSF